MVYRLIREKHSWRILWNKLKKKIVFLNINSWHVNDSDGLKNYRNTSQFFLLNFLTIQKNATSGHNQPICSISAVFGGRSWGGNPSMICVWPTLIYYCIEHFTVCCRAEIIERWRAFCTAPEKRIIYFPQLEIPQAVLQQLLFSRIGDP